MARLAVNGVSKRFGPTVALSNVSLSVAQGEIRGLCGQNGAGKSTLVNIITGVIRPDGGTLVFDGTPVVFHKPTDAQAAGIAVADQELTLVPVLSIEENIRLGGIDTPFLRRPGRRDSTTALLRRVGIHDIDPRAKVESLSMPHRQLIEIARLLSRRASLLVLDEPTASLSRGDSLIVFKALRELATAGNSVLYVSHRLDEVLDLCDGVTVLRDGVVVADRPAAEFDHASLVEAIVGAAHSSHVAVTSAPEEDGAIAQDVSARISVPGRVEDVSIGVRAGEIVALAGQVGCGATEVLRSLAGLEPTARAFVKVGAEELEISSPAQAARAGFQFVSNDRRDEGLFHGRSIAHNLAARRLPELSVFGIVSMRRLIALARALAERVAVKMRSIDSDVAELSGGNQQKVFIGRSLHESSRLLLLDEPTRGVDVGGRAEIHDLIRKASGGGTAVLFASGEPEEIRDLADTIVCLYHGKIVATYPASKLTDADLLALTTRGTLSPPADERSTDDGTTDE